MYKKQSKDEMDLIDFKEDQLLATNTEEDSISENVSRNSSPTKSKDVNKMEIDENIEIVQNYKDKEESIGELDEKDK